MVNPTLNGVSSGVTLSLKSGVSAYRSLLNLRHWLAHGRYWSPKLGRSHEDYDAELVHDELTTMFTKLTDIAGWA